MSEVSTFVHDALARGKTRAEVQQALLRAGWRPDEVKEALAQFADIDFPVPVPVRRTYLSARDAFQHLLAFLTLYLSAVGVGTILFQLVNLALPDPLLAARDSDWRVSAIYSLIRSASAAVIIAFPVYVWMTRSLQKAYQTDPGRRASPVRKWLTYMALFVAAATVIGYLIALAYQLLGGELVPNLALKVVVICGIAAAVFGFYLPGLRREERENISADGQIP